MTTSAVTICSNALLMLGDNPISAFDENTDRARLASNLWPMVRDYVLRAHPWNCAVKRVILAPLSTPPAFDYSAQFLLPDDHLRTLSVGIEGERPRYRVESGVILMDGTACHLRYIWRNEQPATWDSMLSYAATLSMRAVFAYGVTQSTSLEQMLQSVLAPVLRQARAVDGSEDEPEALDDNPLTRARHGVGVR
jgi:hypothetical protein